MDPKELTILQIIGITTIIKIEILFAAALITFFKLRKKISSAIASGPLIKIHNTEPVKEPESTE